MFEDGNEEHNISNVYEEKEKLVITMMMKMM